MYTYYPETDQSFQEFYENNYDFISQSESQIINLYQIRCYELEQKLLEEYLKTYKPHFQLQLNYQYDQKYQEIKVNRSIGNHLNLEVFDSLQNIRKQLIIFGNKKQQIIDYYIELFKYFPRKDLISNLYDSYYLDSKKTFYVFEIETCNQFLQNLAYNLQERITRKLKSFFCEYLLDLFDYPIQNSFQNQRYLKVNLFCFQSEINRAINQHKTIYTTGNFILKDQLFLKQKNQIQYSYFFTQFQNFPKDENYSSHQNYNPNQQNDFDEEEDQPLNQQNWFEKSIFVIISKEKLIEKIRSFYPDLLEHHEEDIFQFIQQHPKYEKFQVLSFNSETFKLKIRTQKDIKLLLVSKFSSLEKVEEEEKIINLQAKITKNLISTEIIFIQKYFYLFVEYDYFKPNKFTLSFPSIQDLLLASQKNFKNQLIVFQILAEISYELYSKFKIRITNICPSKIKLLGAENSSPFNVVIEQINCNNFDLKYSNLIQTNEDELDEINSKSERHINSFYKNLIHHIDLLKYIIDLQQNQNQFITQNNKLFFNQYNNYYQNGVYLIKYAELTISLETTLYDYIKLHQEVEMLDSKICNQFFKKQWYLPGDQQHMHFIKKLEAFLNTFNKNNIQQINNNFYEEIINLDQFKDQTNRQEDLLILNPFLTDLQNLLNIILTNNLNQDSLEDEDGQKIGSTLKKCSNLSILNIYLRSNHLNDPTIISIAQGLKPLTGLQILKLNCFDNSFSDVGVSELSSALQGLNSLITLELNL
ncbi:hypothetical protein ABPG72_006579, partial [Tetrahymena utriculariae]